MARRINIERQLIVHCKTLKQAKAVYASADPQSVTFGPAIHWEKRGAFLAYRIRGGKIQGYDNINNYSSQSKTVLAAEYLKTGRSHYLPALLAIPIVWWLAKKYGEATTALMRKGYKTIRGRLGQ